MRHAGIATTSMRNSIDSELTKNQLCTARFRSTLWNMAICPSFPKKPKPEPLSAPNSRNILPLPMPNTRAQLNCSLAP